MNDKELLQLAAKAAGLTVWAGTWPQDDMLFAAATDTSGVVTGVEWNPLTSDADALRLAVKLRITVALPNEPTDPQEVGGWTGSRYVWVKLNDDPCAATRRAIVRAAAEIGKGMP